MYNVFLEIVPANTTSLIGVFNREYRREETVISFTDLVWCVLQVRGLIPEAAWRLSSPVLQSADGIATSKRHDNLDRIEYTAARYLQRRL
jgi:hypothetical protein